MSWLCRVELHQVEKYDEFHAEMSKQGFVREIKKQDGKTYKLPSGTYLATTPTLSGDLLMVAIIGAALKITVNNPEVLLIPVSDISQILIKGLEEVQGSATYPGFMKSLL